MSFDEIKKKFYHFTLNKSCVFNVRVANKMSFNIAVNKQNLISFKKFIKCIY